MSRAAEPPEHPEPEICPECGEQAYYRGCCGACGVGVEGAKEHLEHQRKTQEALERIEQLENATMPPEEYIEEEAEWYRGQYADEQQ